MNILTASRAQLEELHASLTKEYENIKAMGLKLDMSRGKPCKAQLDLSEGLLTAVSTSEDTIFEGVDTRNYSHPMGIPACRKLFGDLVGMPAENVIIGGTSSIIMLFDTISQLMYMGDVGGNKPWSEVPERSIICPVPGYDRHFEISQYFGLKMIPVAMTENGPDMDQVEEIVKNHNVKGMWCVPKYSNPDGAVYSEETIRRLASMEAAPDFHLFWDNAYNVHNIRGDKAVAISNIYDECVKAGNPNRPLMFCSTSKITFPGAGVACFSGSMDNVNWMMKRINVQSICQDKLNQLRHVRFFGNAEAVYEHMKKHAEIIRPKFDMVCDILRERLGDCGFAKWMDPEGGYFVSFDGYPGCAKRVNKMCKDAGVVFTGPGATFPYGNDPQDTNQRIAPTMPETESLKTAINVFCTVTLLCAVEKRLTEI